MAPRIPRVALLIETSRAYGRGLLRGVRRYIQEHGPWSVSFRPQGLGEAPPAWLASWRGDGILVRADTRRLARAVAACNVPTIDLRFAFDDLGWPTVGVNNRKVIELAVQHLISLGLCRLAFCGLPAGENVVMDYRARCFAEVVAESGHDCRFFPPKTGPRSRPTKDDQEALADWLTDLPKPVGVMTCNDDRGLELLEACRRAGVRVPDEVAVIGVDNDEMLCGLSDPPLSSVDVGVERVGHRAAALLDHLMRGGRPPKGTIYFPPSGVVVRRSTEILQVEDADLREVIRSLRERACDGVRVEELLARGGLSSSTLKRRFRKLLGRSPKEEVTRVRMETAKRLLAETELPVAEVAVRCGFSELKHFSRAFHIATGTTPREHRRQARKG